MVALVTLGMFIWTWNRCPELITDFGREAYVPWRISEGQVLYRDLNYFNGPLSPNFNAALFKLFGASLMTLKVANATIAVLTSLLIYWMVRQLSDTLTAIVAGLTFPALFAAAHLSGAGNFNWLTPYSHDATHGVALSLAMLACLWRAHASGRIVWSILAGLALGLVLLTKVEVGIAAVCGAASALAVMLVPTPGRSGRASARHVVAFVIPAGLLPLAAIALLALAMPLPDAARGAAGAWLWLGDDRISGLPFFRWVMGTDEPERNVARMLGWTGAYIALLVTSLGLALLLRRRSKASLVAAAVAGLVVAVAMELTWRNVTWSAMLRPLPLVLLLAILVMATRWITGRETTDRALPRLSLTVFALALLLKIVLNVRAFHYGFALAMPATMVLVALLVSWSPAAARRLGGEPWVARAVVLAVVLVLLRAHVEASRQWMAQRVVPIGSGPDRFMTDVRGWFVNEVMREVERQRRPGETLVGMPEGAMINFLLRMPSPSRFQNFLPSEMMIYGERAMLADLAARPPTFVAVVHRVAREYSAGPQKGGYSVADPGRFGTEYGQAIARWIRENYHPVLLAGAMPFESDEFGVLLLRRNDPGTTTTTTAPAASPGNMGR